MIPRTTYLEKIKPFIEKNIIKVITGVRRSGKTVFLHQIQDALVTQGVSQSQIVSISLESLANRKFTNAITLYEFLVAEQRKHGKKAYIFLDEIQAVVGWEKVVSSIMVDIDADIYITGSNSSLLSGELATLIAGRYVQIKMLPFSLSEAKEIAIQTGKYTSDESLFADYLRYGGLPQRFAFNEGDAIKTYLSDTYEAIVLRDIALRNNVKDIDFLINLMSFIMDNVGNSFSARSLASTLTASGIKTSTDTIISYLGHIKNAMIVSSVKRYDLRGKKLLTTNEKFYSVDLGLRNVIKQTNNLDYNKLYENIVYSELLYRGYEVNIGKDGDAEIDFIARKGTDIAYIQVCYALPDETTIKREFGNLEKINDCFPRFVISGDIPDFSRNGIKHYNIIDFLLKKPTITIG